jgi:hypothetical protein
MRILRRLAASTVKPESRSEHAIPLNVVGEMLWRAGRRRPMPYRVVITDAITDVIRRRWRTPFVALRPVDSPPTHLSAPRHPAELTAADLAARAPRRKRPRDMRSRGAPREIP